LFETQRQAASSCEEIDSDRPRLAALSRFHVSVTLYPHRVVRRAWFAILSDTGGTFFEGWSHNDLIASVATLEKRPSKQFYPGLLRFEMLGALLAREERKRPSAPFRRRRREFVEISGVPPSS